MPTSLLTTRQNDRISRSNHILDPGDCVNSPGAWPVLQGGTDVSKRTCSVPRCGKPHKGRGLCDTHLYRQKAGLPLEAPLRASWKGVPCLVEECERRVAANGLCSLHWQRDRNGVPLDAPTKTRNLGQPCAVSDCGKAARQRGWCPTHYARWRQHGDPTIVQARTKSTAACSVDGCERPHYAVDMCHFHRRRVLAGIPLDAPAKPSAAPPCGAPDCDIAGRYRGLCRKHRQRADYRDDPTPFKAKTAQRRGSAARGMSRKDRVISVDYRAAIAGDACAYCGRRIETMHVDHYFPVAKGGTDHWWNLVQSCQPCNSAKWAYCGTRFLLMRSRE